MVSNYYAHISIIPFLIYKYIFGYYALSTIKGSQIFLNMIRMNRNPKFWGENANEFYPERFLSCETNGQPWHPFQVNRMFDPLLRFDLFKFAISLIAIIPYCFSSCFSFFFGSVHSLLSRTEKLYWKTLRLG